MKQGKNLTRKESDYVKSFRLNPNNWMLSKKLLDEWLIVHRESGRARKIPAPTK
ncbi:hypothetical protein P4604_18345 [Lysinibacillus capsici]|uniref:DUF6906 family protein n=1 Tax=Lysinibacillus capsici TaxID=2115968 RepID=UPI002E238FE0|nr:hypothetical protein [Lysinibacillus capsici]